MRGPRLVRRLEMSPISAAAIFIGQQESLPSISRRHFQNTTPRSAHIRQMQRMQGHHHATTGIAADKFLHAAPCRPQAVVAACGR